MCFVEKVMWLIMSMYQIKSFKAMDLFMIINENKPYYVYINDFNRFICNKTKCKNKKNFFKHCLQCFSSKSVLVEHWKIIFVV